MLPHGLTEWLYLLRNVTSSSTVELSVTGRAQGEMPVVRLRQQSSYIMRRRCVLHHRDGWHNHLTVMLGAASAADVPSDRRHPRLPHQHAPGSTLMSFGISLQVRFGYVFRVIACVQYTLCTKLSYRRGTARYAISVEILSTTAQLYGESHMKMFAMSDLEDYSRSSELARFDTT